MSKRKTQIKTKPGTKIKTKEIKKKELDWFNLEEVENNTYNNLKNKVKTSHYGFFRQPKERMILIGDIHGDFEALEMILVNQAEVLERKTLKGKTWYRWIGGKAWVICLGDLIDRCREESIFETEEIMNYATGKKHKVQKTVGEGHKSEMRILDLLNMSMIQADKSGGKVIKIMGNHDFESIPSTANNFYLKYSSPYFFYQTLNDIYKTKALDPINYKICWDMIAMKGLKGQQIRSRLRNYYFRVDGLLNCKLRAGYAFLVVQIGDWIMAHGGVLRSMIEYYHQMYHSKHKTDLKDILSGDERLTKYDKSTKKKNLFDYLKKYDPAIEKLSSQVKHFENPWVQNLDGKTWLQIINETFYRYARGTLGPNEVKKLQTYMWAKYNGDDSVIYDRSLGDHGCNNDDELSTYHQNLYQKIINLQLFHFQREKELKIAIAHCPQINNWGQISQSYLPHKETRTGKKTVLEQWIETRIDNRISQQRMYHSGISGDLPDQKGIPRLWRLDVAYSRAFDTKMLKELVAAINNGSWELFSNLVRFMKARTPQCLEIKLGQEPRILAANPMDLERSWLKEEYPRVYNLLEKKINQIDQYPVNPPYVVKLE